MFALIGLGARALGHFAQLAAVSAMARLFFSAATCLAIPVLRRSASASRVGRPGVSAGRSEGGRGVPAGRSNSVASQPSADRAFTVPGGPIVPLAAAAVSVWLLTGMTRTQATAGCLALVTGAIVFGVNHALRHR